MFADRRTYKALAASDEGIATNILADRLERLVASGILTSDRDPEDGRGRIYRLTAKGVDLAPVLLELGTWGSKYEDGVEPPTTVAQWKVDRDRLLAGVRRRWRQEGGSSSKAQAHPAAPPRRTISDDGRADPVAARRRGRPR